MIFLYILDLNKHISQEKVDEISLGIFGLPEDAENSDEESKLRMIFGNYEILHYSLYFYCYFFEIFTQQIE